MLTSWGPFSGPELPGMVKRRTRGASPLVFFTPVLMPIEEIQHGYWRCSLGN